MQESGRLYVNRPRRSMSGLINLILKHKKRNSGFVAMYIFMFDLIPVNNQSQKLYRRNSEYILRNLFVVYVMTLIHT
jgi:hypothetical protein